MCPVCLATAAWIATATISTGGMAALVLKRVIAGRSGGGIPEVTPAHNTSTKED